MKKRHFFVAISGMILCVCLATAIVSAEEKFEDVVASVSINSAFKLAADTIPIDFGVIAPGKAAELYPDRHFNEVKCTSNNGKAWYLKAYCENLTGPAASISKTHLKFKIFWTNGTGYHSSDWTAFGDTPVLVYTSSDMETRGAEIKIQFTYKLEPPAGVPGGNYNAIVTYTMTESP